LDDVIISQTDRRFQPLALPDAVILLAQEEEMDKAKKERALARGLIQ
jgi:hypothetical protein